MPLALPQARFKIHELLGKPGHRGDLCPRHTLSACQAMYCLPCDDCLLHLGGGTQMHSPLAALLTVGLALDKRWLLHPPSARCLLQLLLTCHLVVDYFQAL